MSLPLYCLRGLCFFARLLNALSGSISRFLNFRTRRHLSFTSCHVFQFFSCPFGAGGMMTFTIDLIDRAACSPLLLTIRLALVRCCLLLVHMRWGDFHA
ncbi:unnamed protein product [Calypogeia fissa]